MMDTFTDIAMVCATLFLLWYFFTGILGRSTQGIIAKLAVAIIYIAIFTTTSIFIKVGIMRTAITVILTFFAAKLYYGKSWLPVLYSTILFFLFALVSGTVCGLLLRIVGFDLSTMPVNNAVRSVYIIFCTIMHLLFLHLILIVFKPKNRMKIFISELPILLCQCLIVYLCQKNILLVIEHNAPRFLFVETFCLFLVALGMCACVEMLSNSYKREQESLESSQRLQLQLNYYDDVLKRQEETGRLWHDINKYLLSMEALVDSDRQDDAQKLMGELKSSFSKITKTVQTGNDAVDAILNYAQSRAEDKHVTMNIKANVDSSIAFPIADLFVIIGNTADNAIEACSVMDGSDISIILNQKNHILYYEISNPYKIAAPNIKPTGVHGYGLKNVKTCVEKNNGFIKIDDSNEVFRVMVTLPLNGAL